VKEARFCDYVGAVGKCGLFVGYGVETRCQKHIQKKDKTPRQKIGKYSGFSNYQESIGSWNRTAKGDE